MKHLLTLILSLCFFISVSAQKKQALFVGPGFGLDHGGIGLKTEYQPFKYLGIFLGLGYDFVGPSGNFGFIYNILPKQNFTPVLIAMGGVTGVIITKYTLTGSTIRWENRGQYAGGTVGAGFDIKFGRRKNQKANFMLLVPIRDKSFYEAKSSIVSRGGTIEKKEAAIVIALGWNINLLNLKAGRNK
jgi:hypothetical protein